MKRKSWVQPSKAAEYFGVAASTIRRWIADGKFRVVKLPTGHLRILARDVVRNLVEQGRPLPDELGDLRGKYVLIVDPDHAAAVAVAKELRRSGGCKVTIAGSADRARGMLNGSRPDLVVLGVRRGASGKNGNGGADMLVLAAATDDPPPRNAPDYAASFLVNDILPIGSGERVIVSRVADVLLG